MRDSIQNLTLNQLIRMEDWPNVVALIEAGADIHVASGSGSTPLMQAVEKGVFELVELLISKGAFINFAGRGGITPLHIAVDTAVEDYKEAYGQSGGENCKMIELLLSRGANPSQKNDGGETPLDWAGYSRSQKLLSVFDC